MLGSTYYHGLIRTYIIYFGSLFADIYINRPDANGNIIESLKVPLSYAPKEKFLTRMEADPKLNNPFAITLPRISFELKTLEYDGDRKWNKNGRIYNKANSSILNIVSNPVPYNLNFELAIMVKNAEDGTRILEQICPFFTPDWTARLIFPIQGMPNIEHDIPIVLEDVSLVDTYAAAFTERRAMVWTLQFMLKGYLYGPVSTIPQIRQMYINFKIPSTNNISDGVGNTKTSEFIYIQPGLTANGQGTTNVALSIPPDSIESSDPYDFIVEFEANIA